MSMAMNRWSAPGRRPDMPYTIWERKETGRL